MTSHDNELPLTIAPHGRCRVLYEEISPSRIFVHGIFTLTSDAEVDFTGLPVDVKDFILAQCREECNKRKKNEQ